MNDDSRKRKEGGGSPISRLQRSSLRESRKILQGARVQAEKARVEFQQNPQLRHDVRIGGLGLLLGIILGGLLAKTSTEKPLLTTTTTPTKGWNPIHVFYGQMNHLYDPIPEQWYVQNVDKNNKPGVSREWFGQHGQDVAVAKFLNMKKNGFFVDLAANDAVWASNTFALETNLGWKGICIEANPVYWYRLAFRTNCHVVGSIVGGKDLEELKVQLPTDAKAQGPFGGIVGEQFDNQNTLKHAEPRYTVSLLNLLKKFNAPQVIDYLSMDVEGAEEFILKDFPFHKPYTFKVITIERPKPLLKERLEQAGYKQVLNFKRGDTLWAHSSVYEAGKKRVENLEEAIKNHVLDDWPPAAVKKSMR